MKNKKFTDFLPIVYAAIILCFIVLVSFFVFLGPKTFLDKNKVSCLLVINKGEGVKSVASSLYSNDIIRSKTAFYIYSRLTRPVIKAGVFEVSSSMSIPRIVNLFTNGVQSQLVVSVPEGLTMRRIGTLLEEKNICSSADFLASCKNPELIRKYGLDSIPTDRFEGFLFPDTYYFLPGMNSDDVLCTMVDNFFDKTAGIPGFSSLDSSKKYYVLTLASVVEREYRLAEEAPLIASVFTNRIKKNIGLYSCATIEYIITEIEGKPHPDVITYEDLKVKSPYNTYMYAGLPPTPISNPGFIALNAACNPAQTNYYYFRLVNSDIGKHHFSENFDEHTETGRTISTKKAAEY